MKGCWGRGRDVGVVEEDEELEGRRGRVGKLDAGVEEGRWKRSARVLETRGEGAMME